MATKPGWLKDAVATTAGWVNPKNNEILLCVKHLPDALLFSKGKIVWPEAVEAKAPEAPAEEVKAPEAPAEEVKPAPKKPGRPKKVVDVSEGPAEPEVSEIIETPVTE